MTSVFFQNGAMLLALCFSACVGRSGAGGCVWARVGVFEFACEGRLQVCTSGAAGACATGRRGCAALRGRAALGFLHFQDSAQVCSLS